MSDNYLYITGTSQKATPASRYNRLPLRYLNPVELAAGYTDSSMFSERAKMLTVHGLFFGLIPVTYFQTMKDHLTVHRFSFANKGRFLTQATLNGALGAASFFSYVAGVKLVDDLRGNPDDAYNHFAGAFFLLLPAAVYKRNPYMLFARGFQLGLLTALAKMIYKGEHSILNYDPEPGKITYCRYPELYMYSIYGPDSKEAEKKAARDYQLRDL